MRGSKSPKERSDKPDRSFGGYYCNIGLLCCRRLTKISTLRFTNICDTVHRE